ncbi:arabinogalactan protein 41-like [Vicia villosa]|uniref:arabinogalactan protein 41-like n=1 Tax=Vicia villosa TaxID=3911 RepID=UPI00273B7322|nr:arabinogalactan protein 41-like [Vicia villosa]
MASFRVVVFLCIIYATLMSVVSSQSIAPAPAPTSDGTTIDQAVACLLMLFALVLTYIIH